MAVLFLFLSLLCMSAVAAPPPARQEIMYQQQQRLNNLDYYVDHQDRYYNQAKPKQVAGRNTNRGASRDPPARLETLEPDSEVELIPGAQPQQPPQQSPVSPNLPGLVPGQRVYIVNMPIPGYRPGTIGGYQPVYVIAAASNGSPGYQGGVQPGNPNYVQSGQPNYIPGGYQNTILLDPSGQVISPYLGFQRGLRSNPSYLLPGQNQYLLNRPYDAFYQDPAYGYHPLPRTAEQAPTQAIVSSSPSALEGTQGSVRLAQLVTLNSQGGAGLDNPQSPRTVSDEQANSESERSRSGSSSGSSIENGSKEDDEEDLSSRSSTA